MNQDIQNATHTQTMLINTAEQIQAGGTLQSKNVRIHNKRTSVRLEPEMWDSLKEISTLERCSVHDLCGAVHDLKEPAASFTAALRVFLMEYYRSAAKASQHVNLVQKKIRSLSGEVQVQDTQPLQQSHKMSASV
jgi:predicted DNA-binding ribbon-helix-helix protein